MLPFQILRRHFEDASRIASRCADEASAFRGAVVKGRSTRQNHDSPYHNLHSWLGVKIDLLVNPLLYLLCHLPWLRGTDWRARQLVQAALRLRRPEVRGLIRYLRARGQGHQSIDRLEGSCVHGRHFFGILIFACRFLYLEWSRKVSAILAHRYLDSLINPVSSKKASNLLLSALWHIFLCGNVISYVHVLRVRKRALACVCLFISLTNLSRVSHICDIV